MNRAERAKELFYEGYNCSQAVVAAFADLIETDEKTAVKQHQGQTLDIGIPLNIDKNQLLTVQQSLSFQSTVLTLQEF